MRARPTKKRGKSKKGRVHGAAKPIVFRLAGLASRAASSALSTPKPAPREGRSHPMAALVAGVSPLEGVERVVRPAKRSRSPRAALEPKAEGARFVLRRDAGGVHGYRADLYPRPSVPGRAVSWIPEVQLDLHRSRARDVDARIALSIGECLRFRRTRLLVIHGKGLHSLGGESVLVDAAVESLTTTRHARYVRAFAPAPDRLGGAGALAVDLEPFPD